jgi:hypothetical protein
MTPDKPQKPTPPPADHAMMRGMLQVLMQTIVICRKAWPDQTRRMLEKVVKS